MSLTERDAERIIDQQLYAAGWVPEQIRNQYETSQGPADYVLFVPDAAGGSPVAVIEAKRAAARVESGLDQAEKYARALNVPFFYAANSRRILFRDRRFGRLRELAAFHSPSDLERHLRRFRVIDTGSKDPRSLPIPEWLKGDPRWEVQAESIRAIEHAWLEGRRAMFIEMATGMGKTMMTTALIYHLLESRHAERILFLVDRDELATQAIRSALKPYLSPHGYSAYRIHRIHRRGIPSGHQVYISTLQTLASANEAGVPAYRNCEVGFFDLVVSDECHRSIYGDWRAALDHFDAVQLGLTATPSTFQDRNTYEFFSWRGSVQPVYRFTFREAVQKGFLVPYRIEQITTDITRQALAGEFRYQGEDYSISDLERRINVPARNREIVNAYLNTVKGQHPKAILFAVTVRHAYELADLLNDAVNRPERDFAKVVVGENPEAKRLTSQFRYEEYPRIACSVDMLTTGFDVPDVEHLIMVRPTRSPILYQQMKGRGSRPHTFPEGRAKSEFVVFDFVGNAEYFHDYEWEEFGEYVPAEKPRVHTPEKPKGEPTWVVVEGIRDYVVERVVYGPDYDELPATEYRQRFEETVLRGVDMLPELRRYRAEEPLTAEERGRIREWLDSPEFYFTEASLRDAYAEPEADLWTFIDVALEKRAFLPREQRVREAFEAWCRSRGYTEDQRLVLDALKEQYVVNRGWEKPAEAVRPDFDAALGDRGGWSYAKRVFGGLQNLTEVVQDLRNSVLRPSA